MSHTHTCTHEHTHTHTHACACMHEHTHMHEWTNTHTHMHEHTHTHACTNTHAHTWTHTQMHEHTSHTSTAKSNTPSRQKSGSLIREAAAPKLTCSSLRQLRGSETYNQFLQLHMSKHTDKHKRTHTHSLISDTRCKSRVQFFSLNWMVLHVHTHTHTP